MAHVHLGPTDPTMRLAKPVVWRATRSPEGAASFRVGRLPDTDRVRVDARGPRAAWVGRHAAARTGLLDDPTVFDPDHAVLRPLAKKHRGVHLPRTLTVVERMVPVILQQLVTWREAMRAMMGLTAKYGEDAPGPAGLRLLPTSEKLARLPEYAFAALGALAKQARTLRGVATHARKLEALVDRPYDEAAAFLEKLPGVGPWTSALTLVAATGHPDAVPLCDLHLPKEVGWALARDRDADDDRMLELLEPFAGHRWRAIHLIRAAHLGPERRGPRRPMRRIHS
ncbi:MAG: DNA-3-methyladenine glycosylase 2 family protein [Myxococcota bacterium]